MKTSEIMNYPEDFEQLWKIYPKRCGGNPKRKAFNAYKARLREGVIYSDLQAGVLRYYNFCNGTAKIGSEYVMQTATFFGLNECWAESWELPKPEIKESLEDKAKRLGIVAQPGWSWEEFERRVQQAR